ncbi:Uncharacterised protein [Klebsiella pneumoniae]|uniref:Uncharacterized protein n=1 Tax=Klebsiella pneumoniae TaxID=573 RepID=A0A2X1Q8R1_KLEPN|nr:Uncharacterised protein [Klebsiella pneumoniae]
MRIVVGGEVFAGDFFEGEETMTLGAVINKRGFKAGFNAGDFAFVDVRFFSVRAPGLSISRSYRRCPSTRATRNSSC